LARRVRLLFQERRVILEIAQLQVKPGQTTEFEVAFNEAQAIISSMPGYLGHELQKCIEQVNHYMLLVRWESVEHHEVGFRKCAQYQGWRALLHHFYDPFPTVLHYEWLAGPGIAPGKIDCR
jgi:heme-degrading monooxygenase HmoA